jgi:hypothetical protein
VLAHNAGAGLFAMEYLDPASPLFSHCHSWFARLAGQTWSRSGF